MGGCGLHCVYAWDRVVGAGVYVLGVHGVVGAGVCVLGVHGVVEVGLRACNWLWESTGVFTPVFAVMICITPRVHE